ncbi:hypothetical protein [Methylobacterium sp. R2-1]|uniref:hypothetical protein n=1 Tax=Methylobacterium sp. R2-1 TaxID=2587064 RepID=UPI001619A47B|nr:hypothetical protein [Methylobacterium sp. R2-1]MBB2961254.1 hypothetical protein [Methylobacterium sp. R2-1]
MRRAFDWFFRDRRSGAVVIGQWPNWPLWIFAAASALEWLLEATMPGLPAPVFAGLGVVALLSLTVWALDEIVRGVNPWRRCLGAAVLIGIVVSLLSGPGGR